MPFDNTLELIQQNHFDCLILVHPHTQLLEKMLTQLESHPYPILNISKELSKSLLTVSPEERARSTQQYFLEKTSSLHPGPVLCTHPDLLFEPTFKLDPLALFRQAASIVQLIVFWLGDFSDNTLSYAVPEHHHYRAWHISASLIHHPLVSIHRISAS
ncbi:MAG: BREX-3 system P-loop-containing protein BrxF [Chloroflexota bacterium]